MLSEARLTKNLGLENVCKQKNANHVQKKLIVVTKFPDISLTLVKWPKFPDIFSKFPDNSLTWRKFYFSLTFPWHVATLTVGIPSVFQLLSFCSELFLIAFQIHVLFPMMTTGWPPERCTNLYLFPAHIVHPTITNKGTPHLMLFLSNSNFNTLPHKIV